MRFLESRIKYAQSSLRKSVKIFALAATKTQSMSIDLLLIKAWGDVRMYSCEVRANLLLKVKIAAVLALSSVLLRCTPLVAQDLGIYESNWDGTGTKKVISLDPTVTAVTNLSFSPDGGWVVISMAKEQRARLFLLKADGTNLKEITTVTSPPSWGASFSPDGKKIMFLSQNQGNKTAFYSANVDGSEKTLVKDNVWAATLTSDGQKVVFVRTEDVTGNAIFVCDIDGLNEQRLVKGLGYWDPQATVNPIHSGQLAFTEDVISGDSATNVNVALHLYDVQSASEKVLLDNSKKVYLIHNPHFSSDGNDILFDAAGPPFSIGGPVSGLNIYAIKGDGTELREIAAGDSTITLFDPVASPDGKQVFFLRSTLKH